MKILFLGDIVGKIGRKAVAEILPNLRRENNIDLVIANAENLAHGSGVTPDSIEETRKAGVDFFTTGNHWARNELGLTLFSDKNFPIIRPANWIGKVTGDGYRVIEVGATKIAIINLMGQVFMRENLESPFYKLDSIIKELSGKVKIIFVDFHAEATSEKHAFRWYSEGKVSVVVGTHTHVPTSDACILEKGSAYITDVGMCGAFDSVIGDDKKERVAQFLDQLSHKYEIPKEGKALLNSVVIDIDNKTGKAVFIDRIDREIQIN